MPGGIVGRVWYGTTAFLSQLAVETEADPDSALLWTIPEWRAERRFDWNRSSITPDAIGEMIAQGCFVPFLLEYERRARYKAGIECKMRPYQRYYPSPFTQGDLHPFPATLFVVDSEAVEDRYVKTAAGEGFTLPILVSCWPPRAFSGTPGAGSGSRRARPA